jgi:putative peptidoglycan lipid II flippase
LRRSFLWVFPAIAALVFVLAPWIMQALAPGLAVDSFHAAVVNMRILAISTPAAGIASLYWALLYTDRRFAPTAFYQATLNACTIAAALALWKMLGVYAFAIGYSAGSCVQLAVVYWASRNSWKRNVSARSNVHWAEILAKPAFFLVYAAGLGLNITFTRAYATDAGSGMAAALEYCMRGVGVPLAILVNPIANSLLPEIARLKSASRLREAFRLIDRTVALVAVVAVIVCGFALLFREPAIALLFQRGNFTAESTRLVSAVFVGLAPALIGWSLIEITARSLFALNHVWPPVIAAAVPLLVNVTLTLRLGISQPQWLGIGASTGTLAGFAVLLALVFANRRKWLANA